MQKNKYYFILFSLFFILNSCEKMEDRLRQGGWIIEECKIHGESFDVYDEFTTNTFSFKDYGNSLSNNVFRVPTRIISEEDVRNRILYYEKGTWSIVKVNGVKKLMIEGCYDTIFNNTYDVNFTEVREVESAEGIQYGAYYLELKSDVLYLKSSLGGYTPRK